MKKETFKEGIREEAFNGLNCILQWTRSGTQLKLEIIEEMLERFQSHNETVPL